MTLTEEQVRQELQMTTRNSAFKIHGTYISVHGFLGCIKYGFIFVTFMNCFATLRGDNQ